MLFDALAAVSEAMAATPRRSEKVRAASELLRRLEPEEVRPSVAILAGEPLQGRIGVGWATIASASASASASSSASAAAPEIDGAIETAPLPTLTIADVDAALDALVAVRGAGSVTERRRVLSAVLARCTAREQDLLRRLLLGDMRHGALEGVLADAVAAAAQVPLAVVRRAAMLGGSLPDAALAALFGGEQALLSVALAPLRPVQPMLAAPAVDVAEALASIGRASVEWKLDGARLQAHKVGDEVRLFTRNLNDVTARLDGVVAAVRALSPRALVLDGEVLGITDEGAPRRFQDTMGDFGADQPGRGSGLAAFFFDVLHADGADLIDRPWSDRRAVLDTVVPAQMRMPSVVTADLDVAERAAALALEAGHEGVVLKAVDSLYEAGRRGGAWRKVKPVHTLDLVVLAAEWGSGRRMGWLSNLHLGALGDDGDFVMVGKTFKGLTDELLTWQTAALQAIATDAGRHVVRVRPELVVEVAVDGVQASRRYPGGVALRFARVRRYRPDKTAAEADTITDVQRLLH